ncbi:hypothetical protein Mgra_00008297 [Meloidogyne graminicola]|uniref:Uncharacterized protein n=1 Tax=Meloidogyne graminicola TaxID=189291 RepID=A0A8S9ZG65_9BILA|nr:hypothetical protein Mgra_00008297 [Meloidogyne graminicola]
MGDNLLESYNPLYDVHLRQYFALPHMQKHLRNLGLLEGSTEGNEELHEGHLQMMDMMLRNRERVLQQLVDLQRKLDAAEKVELYRRIRSGVTNAEELERSHVSRSLSRPARSALGNGRFSRESNINRRQQSHSPEAGDLIKRVETDYRADSAPIKNSKSIYNRLAANAYKYQYLHKLDDRTLRKYMNSLRKQLAKLERFREVSFGPHTMAKHQPTHLQQSWFFRRRSLPSLEAAVGATNNSQSQQANGGWRSLKSGQGRKSRSGKSQSPRRATTGATADEPLVKIRRTSMSRTRTNQKLPPLPQVAKRSFTGNRSMPTPGKSMEHKLPPTAVTKQAKKANERPIHRPPPKIVQKAPRIETQNGTRSPLQKGSITPVKVQKPSSLSGALPVIGTAAAVGGVAAIAATIGDNEERKEEENIENVAPSPSISLAASQTTTTDGQPAGDSEWEGDQVDAHIEIANEEEEARPTPGPHVEDNEVIENHVEDSDGQLTARTEVQTVTKEKLKEEGYTAMADKENEENVRNEVSVEEMECSPRKEEEIAFGLGESVSKNISSPENEDSLEIPSQACSLQQQRAKREIGLAAEDEEGVEENAFEHNLQKEEEEHYENKENEKIISPKNEEEIIEQQSPENLMNGGQYGQNDEIEGSEHSVEIKENLKEEEPMVEEIDKRVLKDKEGNFQESSPNIMTTPLPENKNEEEERNNEELQDEKEEKVVVLAESPLEEKASISQHSDSVKGEFEGSQRGEIPSGNERPLDSTLSVENGFHYSEGHEEDEETPNEKLEAERDLEHRYEFPESKTVPDHIEEPVEHFDNKIDDVFEDESSRRKREVGSEDNIQLTEREEEKHLESAVEDVKHNGIDTVHTGMDAEEHAKNEIEELKREGSYSEQHTERTIKGEDKVDTVGENKHTGADEEGFGREEENFGREEESFGGGEGFEGEEQQLGRVEHVMDTSPGQKEYTEGEHVQHMGSVQDEHFEMEDHNKRDSLQQIKGPDETEFAPLVESESVQPTTENTGRKLSGSDKYIIESDVKELEERPDTMMSLTNDSHVLPNYSEHDNYSRSEKEEENDEVDLVHSEESEYNRPESGSKFSVEDGHEVRHELFEPGQEGSAIQHEEISKVGNEDHEMLRRQSVEMTLIGQEDKESKPEEREVISDVKSENEGLEKEFEDRPIASPENISKLKREDLYEDRPPIEEFKTGQSETSERAINEDSKHLEEEHGSETFRSEHSEDQSLNEKEETMQHSKSPSRSVNIDDHPVFTSHSRPFLQQPSIEITPASDHGEFVEFNYYREKNVLTKK